jgi:hypothetical protein
MDGRAVGHPRRALEDRGLRFRLDGDDLIISPKELITDADRTQLKRWKVHVRALIHYCDSGRAVQ